MKFLPSFLLILFFFASVFANGQEMNGYILNNNDEKTECFVRNNGIREASNNYKYRLPGEKEFNEMDLAKIKEFAIYDEVKCVRELIQIDASDDRIKREEEAQQEPELDQGHAYLNVLYEGPLASLYSYYNEGKTFYYYRVGEASIELLYYKKYQLEVATGVVEKNIVNNAYKDQLAQALNIKDEKALQKLSYTKNSLIRFFDNYHKKNSEQGKNLVIGDPKPKIIVRGLLNGNTFSAEIQNYSDTEYAFFKEEMSVGYGLEVEYNFAFNRNKFSVFAGGNYATYFSDYSDFTNGSADRDKYIWDYYSIDIPFGVRYYGHLFPKARIFVEAGLSPHIILDKSELFMGSDYEYSFDSATKGMFGVGLSYGRFAVETRFYTKNNVTQNLNRRGSNLSQWTVSVQYDIFQHTLK